MVTQKSVVPAGNRTPFRIASSLRLRPCDPLLNSEHNIVISLPDVIQYHFSVGTKLTLLFFTFGSTVGASEC